jgi:integrase
MSRPRYPYLHKEESRGKVFWYYRRGRGRRIRIEGVYGSAPFMAAYRAAAAEKPVSKRRMRGEGTFEWLWNLYLASPTWAALSPATRKQRLNLIKPSLKRAGSQLLEQWDHKFIMAGCDARASTPAQARNWLGTIHALFKWARSRRHVENDPTREIELTRVRGDGFHTWSPDELKAFEERWPIGTRERLAYDLMLWTGLRRGDAARVGPPDVVDGSIVLDTAKTGQGVSIRILPPLAQSIQATPTGVSSFVAREDGLPMVKEGFGNWFGEACREAGVSGSAHGLRKALAVKLAESGAADREIAAILGNNMAAFYARKASVAKLSDAALERLFPTDRLALPNPDRVIETPPSD